MDGFEWLPTECADERYPMQLVSGLLECDGDELVAVPAGKIVNNGWGEIGSRRLVGAPLKPVPRRLEVAWFSYTEDQFFAGIVELPHAELVERFTEGFREPLTRKRVTWSKVIVGMGLGGWTSVWLAGRGLVREVAHVQLEPAELDWAAVIDNPDIERAAFVRDKLRSRLTRAENDALAKHGPPVSSWPRRWTPYRWQIVVEGLQVPLHMFLRSFDGARRFFDFARRPPEELDRAPKQIQITWLTRARKKLLSTIELDETELFGAFDEAGAADLDALTTTLRVELGRRGKVAITVERGDTSVALTRARAEVLSLAG